MGSVFPRRLSGRVARIRNHEVSHADLSGMRTTMVILAVAMLASGCLIQDRGVTPRDYIQAKAYTSWTIEVDSQSGAEPTQSLLNFIDGRLTANVAKPDGIDFVRGTVPGSAKEWSISDIQEFSREHKDQHTAAGRVTTHLLFLRGGTSEDSDSSRVLGVTIGYDLIAIFPDNIAVACEADPLSLFCETEPFTKSTTLHEFGHALGLVNHGTPMVTPHEAGSCGTEPDKGHSSSQQSVMYCAVDTNQIAVIFGDNPPDDFDANDKADLRAVREK